ncbi:MAG: translation initiation factor IF-1 [Planctomycetes bacterium]|nr:translation initiation factor IF-1 [Planctomycetota bacterium]MCC7399165.1 translation initiation factor IF-1 [Planctomycetota bacterium]
MTIGEEPATGDVSPLGETSGAKSATVVATLPNGMFRVAMPDGREMVAHAALDLRKAFTRLIAGDEVQVEVSPFDPCKARIVKLIKFRSSKPAPPISPYKRELS